MLGGRAIAIFSRLLPPRPSDYTSGIDARVWHDRNSDRLRGIGRACSVDGSRCHDQPHETTPADPMTEYIEALATRPELAGRKDEIPGLARAQLDPWRGFDQPPSDVAGRETPGGGDRFGGIARPASNMIASSRSKGPIGGTRAAEDFGRVCDQMSLKLRRRPPVRRRRP